MVLLTKGVSYDDIRRILKVSPSTISRMSVKVKFGGAGLKPVIEHIFKKEASQIMWKEIENLFNLPTKSTLKSAERINRDIEMDRKISRIKNEF